MNPLSQRDPLYVEGPEPPERTRWGWLVVVLVVLVAAALAAWRWLA